MLFPLQATNFTPTVGSLVWLEDPDAAWIDGEVQEVKGEDIKVLCTSGKKVCHRVLFVYIYIKHA